MSIFPFRSTTSHQSRVQNFAKMSKFWMWGGRNARFVRGSVLNGFVLPFFHAWQLSLAGDPVSSVSFSSKELGSLHKNGEINFQLIFFVTGLPVQRDTIFRHSQTTLVLSEGRNQNRLTSGKRQTLCSVSANVKSHTYILCTCIRFHHFYAELVCLNYRFTHCMYIHNNK